MIGLLVVGLLLYLIGRPFYELAHEHNKSRWGFAILGVASYYAGTAVAGLFLGMIIGLGYLQSLADFSDMAIGFLTLPIGLLTCWGAYRLLKSNWEKSQKPENTDTLDEDLIQ
jgi:hypothetical protein